MTEVAYGLLFVAMALAFRDWRHGFMLCVLTALLQDPFRKITPGQPVYFVVMTGAVFGAAWMGALVKGVKLGPGAIRGWRKELGVPFTLYVVLVLAQAAHSYVRYGTAIVPAIGLLSYLAAIPAVVLAYQFALRRGLAGLRQWMWFYVIATMICLGSVFLEFWDFDWRILGEVGEGIPIYDVGTILKAHSGFFRASEIAAWHTATVSCFLFTLLMGRRLNWVRILAVLAVIAFLLSVGVLCGRRKMFVEVAVFLSMFAFLTAWFQKGANKLATAAVVAGLVGYVGIVGLMSADTPEESSTKHVSLDTDSKYALYTARGQTTFESIPQRFRSLGIEPISWAYDSFGLFGAGLGTGSQGVQHFIGEDELQNGAAEGGLGKITMELGIPGLILVAWLLIAFYRYVAKVLSFTAKTSRRHAYFTFGLMGFLLANVAAFSVATQAFGDVFILMTLGWSIGFLLAMPAIAARETQTSGRGGLAKASPFAVSHPGLIAN